MKTNTRLLLMTMMFLQFATWGAWYGQLGVFLRDHFGATGEVQGFAYLMFSIAMIAAPFIGAIADRHFAAQKMLGVLNLVGAVLLFALYQANDTTLCLVLLFIYCLCFAPCLALTNAVAMRQMASPEREFPAIRVMGTLGWIAVINLVSILGVGNQPTIFLLAGASAIVLGLVAFFLPDTPPQAGGKLSVREIIGADAFVLFKNPSFLVFFLASVAICVPLSFYYAHANASLRDSGMGNVESVMSLGQVSEVLFMLLIPFFFRKLGVKWMLAVGLLAWIIRFICFGYGDAQTSNGLLYLAILLHGICYDFFFVTGQIYTDNQAGERIKSQAQALIGLATYGVGMGIGSLLSGYVVKHYTTGTQTNWTAVWLVPAGIAAVVLVIFMLIFKENNARREA